MQPYMTEEFYNPSSPYMAARQVKKALDEARARVAHWLGARPTEIIFTAGATESINIAIHGVMNAFEGANMIALGTEHDSVLKSCQRYAHALAPVQSNGTVNLPALEALLDEHTVLVTIALANNELGTIQPINQVAKLISSVRASRAKAGNPLPLYLHTDASQAAGYLDLHAARLGVDLMTLNGGKIYGPKQTGVLYVKAGTQLVSPLTGGGQEGGVRSGTENVAGIIGFAAALDIVQTDRHENKAKLMVLRDELQHRIVEALPDTVVNGNLKKRLPNSLHLSWSGIDGERLVMVLDEHGVMAATGSACAANKQTASHVLQACGFSQELLAGSLRVTVGEPTTPQDITRAAEIIIRSVRSLQ